MANETPRKIGQYELRQVVGRGGMATVWRAYQPTLDREVAIKLMAGQFSDNDDFLKRFSQEARSIARLRHPNILAVYDFGQADNDQPYIVTELLDGGTLRDYATSRRLDLKEISRIISQIADALDYAHNQGMVHRDIKPSNILMGTQRTFGDRAVLSDFGIVKLLANTNLTQTGTGIGTPEYMSPEQAAGERLDGRSDEYSLGIVLYEILTGVTPYKADTPLAVMMGHVNRPMPDPRTFNPQLSQAVVAVLARALAKYPQERYDSAGAFADDFAQAVGANNTVQAVQPPPRSNPPTPTGGTSQRFQTNPGITSAQAYDYALVQERQGNRQAAFETLSDLQRREPNYRDVPAKLQTYQGQNFQYSGNHTLFRPVVTPSMPEQETKALEVGPYKQSTIAGPYVASDPTAQRNAVDGPYSPPDAATVVGAQATSGPLTDPSATASGQAVSPPVAPAKKSSTGLFVGIGIGVVALIAVIIAVIVLTGGKKTDNPTGVAANPTVTVAASTLAVTTVAPLTSADTTAAITTPATATSASPNTVPTPTDRPDPLRSQVEAVVNDMYNSNGNLKDGVAKLKDLAASNKDSWFVQRELGRAYYSYVRDDGGLPFLLKATGLNPDDALSWAYQALAYSDFFDDTLSQAAIRKALDLNGNSAEVRAASAIVSIRVDPTHARDEVAKALQLDKDNSLTNYAAWAVYQSANDYKTALPYLDAMLAKYPNIASLYYSKGYQFDRQGNTAEAINWYNQALKVDPDFPLAHTGLGQAARLKGDFQTAQTEYQKAISVYSKDVNAFIGLGYTLDALKKPNDAIDSFSKAKALDKSNAEAFNGTAGVYLEEAKDAAATPSVRDGFIKLAQSELQQAVTLAPTYADAYYHQGAAYFLGGQFAPAETAFKKAIQLDSKNALYLYSLAANYVKLNDKVSARDNLRKALQVDPNFTPAQTLLNALGN